MDSLNLIHYRLELFLLRLINRIIQINSLYRSVGRNLDNVHGVNVSKLLFLSLCSTGHSGLLLELVEEVLEGNGSQGSGLSLYLYMLLGLNGLM